MTHALESGLEFLAPVSGACVAGFTVIRCSKQCETVLVRVTRWEGSSLQCAGIQCDRVCVSRWANQGLEFLLIACEPRVLATLTDQQFAVRSPQCYDALI